MFYYFDKKDEVKFNLLIDDLRDLTFEERMNEVIAALKDLYKPNSRHTISEITLNIFLKRKGNLEVVTYEAKNSIKIMASGISPILRINSIILKLKKDKLLDHNKLTHSYSVTPTFLEKYGPFENAKKPSASSGAIEKTLKHHQENLQQTSPINDTDEVVNLYDDQNDVSESNTLSSDKPSVIEAQGASSVVQIDPLQIDLTQECDKPLEAIFTTTHVNTPFNLFSHLFSSSEFFDAPQKILSFDELLKNYMVYVKSRLEELGGLNSDSNVALSLLTLQALYKAKNQEATCEILSKLLLEGEISKLEYEKIIEAAQREKLFSTPHLDKKRKLC